MLLSLFSHYKVNMDDIVTNLFLKLILTFLLYSFIYCPFFWLSYSIECGPGRYGYNCNQSCDGCLSDSCDKGSPLYPRLHPPAVHVPFIGLHVWLTQWQLPEHWFPNVSGAHAAKWIYFLFIFGKR
jgi:hypothetical protein